MKITADPYRHTSSARPASSAGPALEHAPVIRRAKTRTQTGPIRPSLLVLLALVAIAGFGTLSLATGAIRVPVSEVYAILGQRALHLPIDREVAPLHGVAVWNLGFPRILLAILAGAGLALAGVAAQALVRNALAEPFVLGVSSGATLGTVVAAVLGVGLGTVLFQGGAAFAGALFALLLVLAFGRGPAGASPVRLVLAGIAIGHLLAGITGYLVISQIQADASGIDNFLVGRLSGATLDALWLPAVVLAVGLLVMCLDAGRLNALLVGDETAASLGVNVTFLRLRLVLVTAALAGVMVAQAGIIGFVGLVIPHTVRLLVGSDHRRVVPVTAFCGAAYLVMCDYLSYHLAAPRVLPVGLVASAIGAPVFLLLLRRGLSGRHA